MSISISSGLPGGQGAVATPHTDAAPAAAAAAGVSAQATAGSAGPAPSQPSNAQIQEAVKNLRNAVAPMAQNLQFSVDNDTHQTVITVVDSSTKEVIRQIPSEEVLALAKGLDQLQGMLIKRQA